MCLEGRVAALLVALGTVIPGAASGKPPGPVDCAISTPVLSPVQSSSSAAADGAGYTDGVRVAVTLTTRNRDRLDSAAVMMRRDSGEASDVSSRHAMILPDGSFVLSGRRLGRISTNANGRYRYRGLPPGEYCVVASMLEADNIHGPEVLSHLDAAGAPLSLDPLAAPVIDLGLTTTIPHRTSAR